MSTNQRVLAAQGAWLMLQSIASGLGGREGKERNNLIVPAEEAARSKTEQGSKAEELRFRTTVVRVGLPCELPFLRCCQRN